MLKKHSFMVISLKNAQSRSNLLCNRRKFKTTPPPPLKLLPRSTRLSIRLRCARTGLSKAHAGTGASASSLTGQMTSSAKNPLMPNTSPNSAKLSMRKDSVLMETDACSDTSKGKWKRCTTTSTFTN